MNYNQWISLRVTSSESPQNTGRSRRRLFTKNTHVLGLSKNKNNISIIYISISIIISDFQNIFFQIGANEMSDLLMNVINCASSCEGCLFNVYLLQYTFSWRDFNTQMPYLKEVLTFRTHIVWHFSVFIFVLFSQ